MLALIRYALVLVIYTFLLLIADQKGLITFDVEIDRLGDLLHGHSGTLAPLTSEGSQRTQPQTSKQETPNAPEQPEENQSLEWQRTAEGTFIIGGYYDDYLFHNGDPDKRSQTLITQPTKSSIKWKDKFGRFQTAELTSIVPLKMGVRKLFRDSSGYTIVWEFNPVTNQTIATHSGYRDGLGIWVGKNLKGATQSELRDSFYNQDPNQSSQGLKPELFFTIAGAYEDYGLNLKGSGASTETRFTQPTRNTLEWKEKNGTMRRARFILQLENRDRVQLVFEDDRGGFFHWFVGPKNAKAMAFYSSPSGQGIWVGRGLTGSTSDELIMSFNS